MNYDALRILVTGASGFLGRHIIHKLEEGSARVYALTREPNKLSRFNNIHVIKGDINSQTLLRSILKDIDVVFHLAGEKRNESYFWNSNVIGTRNLLVAATANKVGRFVHVGSVGVIGADPMHRGTIDENVPCTPKSQYELSKWVAEKLVVEAGAHGLPVSILRPANVFGDFDPQRGLLRLAKSVKGGNFIFLGGREAICNYVYAEDVALACLALAHEPKAVGRIYHLSDSCTIGEFIDELADTLNVTRQNLQVPDFVTYPFKSVLRKIELFPRLLKNSIIIRLISLNNQVSFATSRLMDELGFKCPVGWRIGLSRMVSWYRLQGDL